ncbi:MAG: hypothetical protein GWN78_09715, partial [Gammaproteobacteria bacterium]|nr:hypothetical protein [Gammaproteobacteria bacterium]
EAIGELQTVLAIEPQNRRALDLRGRLLATQSAQAQERDRLSRIDGLLADAEARLQAGDFNQAAALANNALALDRGNPTAMGYIQQAYAS